MAIRTVLVAVLLTFAQEGHPLVGTWSGDWGPSPTHRNQVTVVMNWDGKNVTGIINPTKDSFFSGIGFAVPINVATAGGGGSPPY